MRRLGVALVVGLLAWLPGGARAASLGPPTEELRKIDVGSIDHPAADAVILYRGVHVRMATDGRVTRRVRQVQRLMTDHAIALGGDPRVAYDTTRQELSIEICRTFMLDGTEVKAAPHAFNRVTPERVASCPDRVGLQEMVISYVGVERGCLTELDYTLVDRVAWRPWLEGVEELGGPYPVRAGDLWIEAPEGVAITGQLVGARVPSFEAAEPFGAPMAGPWSYGPVPACPDEGGLSSMERVPTVVYSTASWEQLNTFVHQRLSGAAAPDSAIAAWAGGNLSSGRPPLDDAERLERIAGLVGERTMEAEDAPLSWLLPVRPASRTFSSSCGNLLDRAALGLAALDASGIEAKIVLHPIGRSIAPAPVLACFGDIRLETAAGVLSVGQGEAAAWMDPAPATNELVIRGAAGSDIRPVQSKAGESRLSLRIAVSEDGSVHGEAAIDARGAFVAGLGVEDLGGFLAGLAAAYARDGELAGYRVVETGPQVLSVVFSFAGKGIGESLGEGRRGLTIPSAPGMPGAMIPEGVSYARDSRRMPLIVNPGVTEDVTFRLELPPGMRPIVPPGTGTLRGPGAEFSASWEREEEAWVYHRRFSTKEGVVSAEEYPSHRAVMLRMLEEGANRVVLAVGTAK
jgi:hypothetical protein